MADRVPEFETSDLKGTTDSYSGTVGTSYAAVPTSAGNRIQEFIVICTLDQSDTNRLSVSLDAGSTTIATIAPGGFLSGPVKGDLTQIHIKGNVSSVSYQVVLNREDYT